MQYQDNDGKMYIEPDGEIVTFDSDGDVDRIQCYQKLVHQMPSGESKARLFKTARLASHVITAMLKEQEIAQSKSRIKYDHQSLSTKCFAVEFKRFQLNINTGRMEPVFHLYEPDGTFFGYLFENDLLLCL